ncbi:MAG: MFS transporter [Halocynthiibacter sp.]
MPNRITLLLMACVGVVGVNSLLLSPIAATVARDLGGSDYKTVLYAVSAFGVGVAISALLLAPISDRIGADRAISRAMLVLIVTLISSGLAPSLLILTLSQSIAGLSAGVAIPALYGLAAHVAPKGKEAQVVGFVLSGWMVSMIAGVSVSAYIAHYFGWRMIYLLLVLATALCWLGLNRANIPDIARSTTRTSPFTALNVPGVRGGLFSVTMLGLGFYGIYNYIGAHLEDVLLRPVKDAGLFTLLYGVGFGLSTILDPIVDRIGLRRGLIYSFLSLGLLYILFAQVVDTYWMIAGYFFIWGIFQHLGLNMTVSRLTHLDPSQRGAIMGLNSTMMYLCVFGATFVYAPLFERFGMAGNAYFSALLILLGAGEAIVTRRRTKRLAETRAS